jgi:hypothetical protein
MTDIRVMSADGTDDRAILPNTLFSMEPRWSVNGQIVFMSLMNSGNLQVCVMNSDGGGTRAARTGLRLPRHCQPVIKIAADTQVECPVPLRDGVLNV